MISIFLHKADSKRGYQFKTFESDFFHICDSHRKEERALFFAFILYDFTSPHVLKMLDDQDYWIALDKISGNKLSVFSFHTPPWIISSRCKKTQIKIDPEDNTQTILSKYFDVDGNISYPSLLFFQVEKQAIIDHFWLKVRSEKIEDVFVEIKRSIIAAVESIKNVLPENYNNSQEIFNLVKRGLDDKKIKTLMSKAIKRAPDVVSLARFIGIFL